MNEQRASLNLENLRKRAKRVVRQHRARHVPVSERIRSSLPAFAGLSDREILDAPFPLHRAQELIARELGFADWTHLKEGISIVSSSDSSVQQTSESPSPELLIAHPQLFVRDIARSVAFYRDSLGFEVGYLYGDPPFYGLVRRGGAALNLRHTDASPWDDGLRDREDLLSATIVTRELKALFLELKAAGVPFHQTLKEQPWGARDFIVRDPDGNLVHFADPT
jgi:catechol 2,3-dioxygenase-like lactoylglutathione lyase family enzyme